MIKSISSEIKTFVHDHQVLCALTLGLAIVGFAVYTLGGRAIAWLKEGFGTTEKVHQVGLHELNRKSSEVPKETIPLTEETSQRALSIINQQEQLLKAIQETPSFVNYKVGGHALTAYTLRPANLFFGTLFKGSGIRTTLPGSYKLFAFEAPHAQVKEFLRNKATNDPDGLVSFSAEGIHGGVMVGSALYWIENLADVYGKNTYRISYKEIQDTLDSQKIYLSPLLPKPFYAGLKKAMREDAMVILPGNDRDPQFLKDLRNHCGAFIRQVRENPLAFGFTTPEHFDEFSQMTLYQIGSMVVKIEDYRILADGSGNILERNAGEQDQVRLINACGIRGVNSVNTPAQFNRRIMQETFRTALYAAGSGMTLFPAVGMGVWAGDPDLYWKAFLDAVVNSEDSIEVIAVHPGHKPTPFGVFKGRTGEEFEFLLNEYKKRYKDNPATMARLGKIFNLHKYNSDLLQLARILKKHFPDKDISIFNASDPDVTLGYHVGEYTNNLPHGASTTEEHYTALGTNGLCFEDITSVHDDDCRVISIK